MSLFVAVIPPAHAIEDLHDTITDVRRGTDSRTVRWTSPDRWHLTLAFLGEPDESVDEDVAEHLDPLCDHASVTGLRLLSAGAFGRQIAWIGLEDGPAKDALAHIAGRIPGLVRGTGVTPDRRTWRPHLTIARLRSGSPDALVSALSAYRSPPWDIDAVHLIRSTGGPHPVHHQVERYPLA